MQAVTSQAKIKYTIFDFLPQQKNAKIKFYFFFFSNFCIKIYFFPTLESYA